MSAPRLPVRSFAVRTIGFLGFWVVLAGTGLADVMAGVFASVVAAYVSLRLSPPAATRPNPVALLQLALRFLRQSVVAGVDVAWRAFHPALPLHPGFVTYHSGMSGRRRDAFCTMTSLLPGTLPVETRADGTILIHCLDTRLPIAEQLKDEEALFARATGSKQ